MKKTTGKVITGLLVLLWMGVIFYFSSGNGESSGTLSKSVTDIVEAVFFKDLDTILPEEYELFRLRLEYLVRKAAHFTEFLILGGLLSCFLSRFRIRFGIAALIAVLCGVLYAASDEVHQLFVTGRAGQIFDFCIDSAGVVTGVFVFLGIIAMARLDQAERKGGR